MQFVSSGHRRFQYLLVFERIGTNWRIGQVYHRFVCIQETALFLSSGSVVSRPGQAA